ncbi:MAG: cytochrome C oxidase subunit IV family protein [Verrucomicrobiota bacterium]
MSDVDYAPLPVADVDHSAEHEKYHTFVNLALALSAITGVELVLVYVPFPTIIITTVLIALSLFKFVAVIAWFMHLIYDKFLLTLAFGTGLVIATGTVIALIALMSPNEVDFDAITGF